MNLDYEEVSPCSGRHFLILVCLALGNLAEEVCMSRSRRWSLATYEQTTKLYLPKAWKEANPDSHVRSLNTASSLPSHWLTYWLWVSSQLSYTQLFRPQKLWNQCCCLKPLGLEPICNIETHILKNLTHSLMLQTSLTQKLYGD